MAGQQKWLLRRFPWRWALYWLVTPNLIMMLMWPWGGPPMGKPILIAGCLGLIASQLPWLWVRRVAVAAITLWLVTVYIGRNFNLDPGQLTMLPVYLAEAAPLRSPLFAAGVAAIMVSLAIVWLFVPRVERFQVPMQWMLGFLAVLGAVQFDTFATAATRGTYDSQNAPLAFTSAVETAGFAFPSAPHRNLVVVVVEALGKPLSPAAHALFKADWDRAEWRTRYDVQSGDGPYFGATVNAEMRELCGVWSSAQIVDFGPAQCLPDRYIRAGYETTAIHAFSGAMFDRATWWRAAGFQHTMFREDLLASGVRRCGGVFPGACDEDVPARIGSKLKTARKPQLIYWLTLNSHLPVLQDASLHTQDCRFGGAALAAESERLCPLFAVHHQLSEAITRMALDPALPPTDILIVGDHMPPYFERDARVRFHGQHVPYVLLRARGSAAVQPAS